MSSPQEISQHLISILEERGQGDYIGESISQLEHCLQAADQAKKAGSSNDTVIAALIHDIGQFLPAELIRDQVKELKSSRDASSVGRVGHELIGEQYLQTLGFGRNVSRLVGSHVAAKRYLTAIDPEYYAGLSTASQKSLELQGGPFNGEELDHFRADPLSDEMVSKKVGGITGLTFNPDVARCKELAKLGAKIIANEPLKMKDMVKVLKKIGAGTICIIPPVHEDKFDITVGLIEVSKRAAGPNVCFLSSSGCSFANKLKQTRLREFVKFEAPVMSAKQGAKRILRVQSKNDPSELQYLLENYIPVYQVRTLAQQSPIFMSSSTIVAVPTDPLAFDVIPVTDASGSISFTTVLNPNYTPVTSSFVVLSIISVPPSSATITTSIDALVTSPTLQPPSSSTTAQPSVSATTQPASALSTGAKAGIGIGAIVGAVLLMLLGAFFSSVIRRRKHKDNLTYDKVEPEPQVQRQMSRKELDGNNILGRNTSRKELDGTHWKRELEGDTPKGLGSGPLQTVAEMDTTGVS
ncbi:hypothetical protein MMC18_007571 [Xylographa bjoerkii]|nr:hypothetical protein [Xylographa bjoerkii]